jgi:hypothetical protein
MPQRPLTKREAWAATYEHLLKQRATPRTDCPTTLPIPEAVRPQYERWVASKKWKDNGDPAVIAELEQAIRANPELRSVEFESSPDMHDLQQMAVRVASGLTGDNVDISNLTSVSDGARFVREQIRKWKKL